MFGDGGRVALRGNVLLSRANVYFKSSYHIKISAHFIAKWLANKHLTIILHLNKIYILVGPLCVCLCVCVCVCVLF